MATSSRLSGVRLSSTTPRRRLATVALSAKPKRVSCRTGGRISDMTSRRSRRIWANSLARSARIRGAITVSSGAAACQPRRSAPELHAAHGQPGERVEDGADGADDRDVEADGRPPAALQEGIPDDLDEVAAPDEVRDPAQPRGNVLDGKDQPREEKDEEKATEGHDLHGGHLARDAGPDHRAERGHTERV